MNLRNSHNYFANEIDVSTLALSHILEKEEIFLFFNGERKHSHHYINLQESTIDLISNIWSNSRNEIITESHILHNSISNFGNEIYERKNTVAVIAYNRLIDILLKHSSSKNTSVVNSNDFAIVAKFRDGIQVGKRNIHEYKFLLKSNLHKSSYHEETKNGWLFTFPINSTEGILQLSTLNNDNISIEKLITSLDGTLSQDIIDKNTLMKRGVYQTSPRISSNIISENHISIGSGLLRFDPICGDGTGLSIKSAILASGIILSQNQLQLKRFYKSKVSNIFNNHLLSCISLYSKYQHDIWQDEIASMKEVQLFMQNNICDNEYLKYKLDFTNNTPRIIKIEKKNTAWNIV